MLLYRRKLAVFGIEEMKPEDFFQFGCITITYTSTSIYVCIESQSSRPRFHFWLTTLDECLARTPQNTTKL